MTGPHVSIGVAGTLGADAIGRLAPVVERAGFYALWVNDTPGADSLAALAAAARDTSTLVLATGVIAVDRWSPDDIIAAVEDRGLPKERLVVGIGSGALRVGALAAVRETAARLRELAPARIMVGALGPRMRELATHADGALLSWLTPEAAAAQVAQQRAVSSDTHVALYARTALVPEAIALRDAEAQRYASYPNYAANLARLGIDPLETVLPRGAEPLDAGVDAFTAAVDELVLRVITPDDDLDGHIRFVEQAAALLGR